MLGTALPASVSADACPGSPDGLFSVSTLSASQRRPPGGRDRALPDATRRINTEATASPFRSPGLPMDQLIHWTASTCKTAFSAGCAEHVLSTARSSSQLSSCQSCWLTAVQLSYLWSKLLQRRSKGQVGHMVQACRMLQTERCGDS